MSSAPAFPGTRRRRRAPAVPIGRLRFGRSPLVWLLGLALAAAFAYVAGNSRPSDASRANPSEPSAASPPAVSTPAAASPPTATPDPLSSPHLLLGNPSRATSDPDNRANYLIVRPQYALSYNDQTATANWASWRLQQRDLGDAPRLQVFLPDDELPSRFHRVTHQDYTNSGFDRGHLVPHSDRDATREDAAATYRMTNIIPQAPNINQRAWASLESYARGLVASGRNTLFIIAGPHGSGGVGSRGPATTIARGRINVPAECWKVIVVVPSADVSVVEAIPTQARVIAVRVPNDDRIDTLEWARFRTTPREIERQTGYQFFDRLPPDLAEAFRDRLDRVPIPAPRTPGFLTAPVR